MVGASRIIRKPSNPQAACNPQSGSQSAIPEGACFICDCVLGWLASQLYMQGIPLLAGWVRSASLVARLPIIQLAGWVRSANLVARPPGIPQLVGWVRDIN